MRGKLPFLGLVLVVSALLLSGCGLAAQAEGAPAEPTMSEAEAQGNRRDRRVRADRDAQGHRLLQRVDRHVVD